MSGALLVLAVILPLLGLAPLLLLRGRALAQATMGARIAVVILGLGLCVALAIAVEVVQSGRALQEFLGGWAPPLGIGLRADGLSCLMLVMSAGVLLATGLFALPAGAGTPHLPPAFFMLLLSTASALNLAFLAQDLFSLYVALELLTFAAVPLVCLDGSAKTLAAALRYLVFALFGSVLYLLAAVLLYGRYGTLDLVLLSAQVSAEPLTLVALALATAGLMGKAAMFPLYLWLPPAHAGAPAAASALLSGVVIKAPLFLVVRLWSDVAPEVLAAAAAPVLAACGAGAIVFCGLLALGQTRLKLLIAYSTAAQIGYLFLMFPLALGIGGAGAEWGPIAATGGALHLVSHACSKAAMFMAAGLIVEALGHDEIGKLAGAARLVPVSVAAFGLGGLSLLGLPPSGGFVAKVMLLTSALQQQAWWIALVILAGSLLAGGYVLKALVAMLLRPVAELTARPVGGRRQWVAFGLALVAVALGFVPLEPLAVLQIGRPAAWAGLAPGLIPGLAP